MKEKRIEELKKEIKCLYDKLEVCVYGSDELQEIAIKEQELAELEESEGE